VVIPVAVGVVSFGGMMESLCGVSINSRDRYFSILLSIRPSLYLHPAAHSTFITQWLHQCD
jgi:hypothetical protein